MIDEENILINNNKNKIKLGIPYKNYQEVCKTLQISIKSGKAKESQIKKIQSYLKYHREGYKWIFEMIYKIPKKIKDDRQVGNYNIFNLHIQKLILDLMAFQFKNNKKKNIFLSTSKLMESLALVNKYYNIYKENNILLAKNLNIKQQNIAEFYNNTYGNLKKAIESALKQLDNKALIIWENVITIASDKKIDGQITEVHAIATQEEKELIIQAEKIILKEMGYTNKKDVFLYGQWHFFKSQVINKLKNKININYYYKSYNITFNKYIFDEQKKINNMILLNETRDQEKHKLNNKVSDKMIINAQNRQNKAKNKLEQYTKKILGIPKTTKLTEMELLRIEKDYINNFKKIAATLINITN